MAAISFGFDTANHHPHEQNKPLSRDKVRVICRLIGKDKAGGAGETAEVKDKAMKQFQNSANYSLYS